MPNWIIKAVIQGALSRLPEPQRYNRLLQKYVTGSLQLSDQYFRHKYEQCERQVSEYVKRRPEAGSEFVALELGTGWFPITPIGLALHGAKRVYSLDSQDLLARDQVIDTLAFYRRAILSGHVQVRRTDAVVCLSELLAQARGMSARELLLKLGIEAVIGDARDSGLPASSVDLLCSNNTLEHIPRQDIVEILREFSRLASEGALMVHFIDLADHYANFDPNITVYNFLRYSDRTWRLFNNELQYLNRLRISDYREIHTEAGFVVVHEDNKARPEQLAGLRLASAFRRYTPQDIAVYETWMMSEVSRGAGAGLQSLETSSAQPSA